MWRAEEYVRLCICVVWTFTSTCRRKHCRLTGRVAGMSSVGGVGVGRAPGVFAGRA